PPNRCRGRTVPAGRSAYACPGERQRPHPCRPAEFRARRGPGTPPGDFLRRRHGRTRRIVRGHLRLLGGQDRQPPPGRTVRRTGVAAGRCPRAAPRTLARVNASDRTPADLLSSALAADPGRPLVTFYDDATGERVELSVATFAYWVAKTANLLQDELSAEP